MPDVSMDRRAWMLFAAVSVVWGVPYFFIRVAVDAGLSPGVVAFSRVALGFLVLLPFALRRRALSGLRERWRWVAAYTVFEIALPFPLIAWGEQRVSSSLAAILVASLPLIIAVLLSRLEPSERPRGLRLIGLFVGFAGVVTLLGLDVAGRPRELLGAVAVLLATGGYAVGPLIIRRQLADLDPLGPICASLGFATLLLAPLAAATPPGGLPADALASIIVLGTVCSALAFLLFFALIAQIGPSRASVITYLNPLVAVILGVAVLGERPGPAAVAGLLLVLAGSWFATGGGLPPGAARAAARLRRPRPALT
ncbi:MAG: DMT family transporter [Solirubrobacterales bacterium]|nr:DMT family transporter [Solirubrobacterales bacterium]